MNLVITTENFPTLRFENRRSPFSSPFGKTNSFMRNVLARVNNPIPAVSTQTTKVDTSATNPAIVKPTQSPIDTTTTLIDAQSIKQETPSPRKPSPTPTPTPTQESIPVTEIQNPNSSVPTTVSTESPTVATSHNPHTGPTVTSILPLKSSIPSVRNINSFQRSDFRSLSTNQRPSIPTNNYVHTESFEELTNTVGKLASSLLSTTVDLSTFHTALQIQQNNIRLLREGQDNSEKSLTEIKALLLQLSQPSDPTLSDMLSLRDSNEASIRTSPGAEQSHSHHETDPEQATTQ